MFKHLRRLLGLEKHRPLIIRQITPDGCWAEYFANGGEWK